MGESLNDLGYEQMVNLIEDIDTSVKLIRETKVSISPSHKTKFIDLHFVDEVNRILENSVVSWIYSTIKTIFNQKHQSQFQNRVNNY